MTQVQKNKTFNNRLQEKLIDMILLNQWHLVILFNSIYPLTNK